MEKKIKAHKLINRLIEEHYERALNEKANGRPVGWCTSNFPQEIVETMGLTVVYPENHAASLAARGEAQELCCIAEAAGYSNDICSYARVNIGYTEKNYKQGLQIPEPDYLLCCTNICCQLMKWYENIAEKFDIPMILIDIPYNTEYETDDIRMDYIRKQFYEAVYELEKITGNKFSDKRLHEVMEISNKVGKSWNNILNYACHKPSPYNGFDLFVYMGAAVCIRGREETLEAFELLEAELQELVESNKSRYRQEEKFRILYEGICCWPYMVGIMSGMARYNMNMTGAVYTGAYGIEYNSFDDMIAAYTYVPNAVNFERAFDMRLKEIKAKKCDGVLVHMSRSCKIWSGVLYELMRKLQNELNIPCISFDGDQADPQNFSEAQFDTRIQGFYELMKEK